MSIFAMASILNKQQSVFTEPLGDFLQGANLPFKLEVKGEAEESQVGQWTQRGDFISEVSIIPLISIFHPCRSNLVVYRSIPPRHRISNHSDHVEGRAAGFGDSYGNLYV